MMMYVDEGNLGYVVWRLEEGEKGNKKRGKGLFGLGKGGGVRERMSYNELEREEAY